MMKRPLSSILALLAALSAGCATTPSLGPSLGSMEKNEAVTAPPSDFWSDAGVSKNETTEQQVPAPDREIAPGWLLKLTSIGDSKISGSFRVDKNGRLRLPYKYSLKAAGLTLANLQQTIRDHYRPFFKRDPQIQVSLGSEQYSLTIQGFVAKPGDYLVSPGEPIDVVLARAGQVDREARYVQIQRGENQFAVDLLNYVAETNSLRKPRWRGGEVLTVMKSSGAESTLRSHGLELLGEVRTPGELSFEPGADFYAYLTRAGGPTAQANLDEVQVIRMTPQGRQVVASRADLIARHIQLSPGDLIIVGNVRPTAFDRALQIGSTAAAILSAIGLIFLVPRR